MRIVVMGYVVRGPLGGIAWHHLQYALGLRALGHDVYFLEDSDDYPSCYDPSRHVTDADPSYGLRFAEAAFARLGLGERWAYFDAHQGRWHGPAGARALEICASADMLLNVSGINPLREWTARIPARLLIDTDPLFVQLRHLTRPDAMALARAHTHFFSFGENVDALKAIADDGLPWRATRQPVFLPCWQATPGPADGAFTTVMQWDSYPAIAHAGREYGMKSRSFGPYRTLPRRTRAPLEIALGNGPAELTADGWRLVDPLEITRDPWSYQAYIRGSKAEFSVAKHGYVASRAGWFSERSCCYLASGRPVLTQDAGWTKWLPAGRGLLAFSTPEEALAGIERIGADYDAHCRWAREIAVDHFDSAKVLAKLLDEVAGRGAG